MIHEGLNRTALSAPVGRGPELPVAPGGRPIASLSDEIGRRLAAGGIEPGRADQSFDIVACDGLTESC